MNYLGFTPWQVLQKLTLQITQFQHKLISADGVFVDASIKILTHKFHKFFSPAYFLRPSNNQTKIQMETHPFDHPTAHVSNKSIFNN